MLLQCNVIDYNSCAKLAYDDLTLPSSATYKYRHSLAREPIAISAGSHLDVLRFIPRDGRVDLSFNWRWFSERRSLLRVMPPYHPRFNIETTPLVDSMERALKDLGRFGLLDISDFDPNSGDRVSYRLSKEQLYFGTVLDGSYFFNQNADDLRVNLNDRDTYLPKCPTTKQTAGWNRIMSVTDRFSFVTRMLTSSSETNSGSSTRIRKHR